MFIQIHNLKGVVGHRHTARSALIHILTLDVGVEQHGVVVGIDKRERTRAAAVVDGGCVWTHEMPFKGDGETLQPADVAPGLVIGVRPGGPRSAPLLIRVGHRLQGLQQQKGTVLVLSYFTQERKQKYQLKRNNSGA